MLCPVGPWAKAALLLVVSLPARTLRDLGASGAG
jgi:hypothetical protein